MSLGQASNPGNSYKADMHIPPCSPQNPRLFFKQRHSLLWGKPTAQPHREFSQDLGKQELQLHSVLQMELTSHAGTAPWSHLHIWLRKSFLRQSYFSLSPSPLELQNQMCLRLHKALACKIWVPKEFPNSFTI